MRTFSICFFLLLLMFVQSMALAFQDEDATRTPKRSEPPREAPRAEPPRAKQKRTPAPVKEARRSPVAASVKVKTQPPSVKTIALANLTIQVNPAESTVLVDENEIESRHQPGVVSLTGIEAGRQHVVTVRSRDYAEQQQTIDLLPGENRIVDVKLSPLPGKLSVDARASDAEITIIKEGKRRDASAPGTDGDVNVGSYNGSISNLTLTPGLYEITMKKSGYETLVREVTIDPHQTVEVTEALEPSRRRPPRTGSLMQLGIAEGVGSDKQYLVSLTGTSGDELARSGSLVLSHDPQRTPDSQSVTGMLPGLPIRVDCVALENVKSCSFVETPGIANQWGRIVVRIRFKNPKKSARYSINWEVVGQLNPANH